jgi:hypothetical protein
MADIDPGRAARLPQIVLAASDASALRAVCRHWRPNPIAASCFCSAAVPIWSAKSNFGSIERRKDGRAMDSAEVDPISLPLELHQARQTRCHSSAIACGLPDTRPISFSSGGAKGQSGIEKGSGKRLASLPPILLHPASPERQCEASRHALESRYRDLRPHLSYNRVAGSCQAFAPPMEVSPGTTLYARRQSRGLGAERASGVGCRLVAAQSLASEIWPAYSA